MSSESVQDGTQPSVQDGTGASNPYGRSENLRRLMWAICAPFLFSLVPRRVPGWHAAVLRRFGAKVGSGTIIYSTARFEMPWNVVLGDHCVVGDGVQVYSLGKISIGSHTVISQRSTLCAGTHDYQDSQMPLVRSSITIGSGCWICAESFVGPGIEIGDAAVVGARSVVIKNLPAMSVCGGNPCRVLKPRIMRPSWS